jgi:hypothetical protein
VQLLLSSELFHIQVLSGAFLARVWRVVGSESPKSFLRLPGPESLVAEGSDGAGITVITVHLQPAEGAASMYFSQARLASPERLMLPGMLANQVSYSTSRCWLALP